MTHHCDLGCVCSVDGLGCVCSVDGLGCVCSVDGLEYVPLFICLIFIDNSAQFCSWMDGNLS